MLKRPKPEALAYAGAEGLGILALAYLAADDARLARFMALTGIGPGDLIARAREPTILVAVLEHMSGDESMLLVFCAEAAIPPESIAAAIALLEAAI